MNEPCVSIILTTLNAVKFLRQAIDSCLNQTYRNLELIVVDGGSTDGTLEIIRDYKEPRMRIIPQQDNAGKLPGAINLGLEQARGEYLTWMQADCWYEPRAIEKMVSVLDEHPDIGQVYADYFEVDEKGEIKRVCETHDPKMLLASEPQTGKSILTLLGDPCGVCFLIRREVRERVGAHHIEAYPSQDYDYRLRIAMKVESMRIPEPLYFWRFHKESLSGKWEWFGLARKDVEIREKLGLFTQQQSKKALAEIEVAQAFELYQKRAYKLVRRHVGGAFRLDIGWMRNRGVWSILIKSLVQRRDG